ncbi:MAG: sigma-54 interaction domain-containing protein [bacterium]
MLDYLGKFFRDRHEGFAVLNRELRLEYFNDLFAAFALPDSKPRAGQEIQNYYPEFIGLEDTLQHLPDSAESFLLRGVNRARHGDRILYLDLQITAYTNRRDNLPRFLLAISDQSAKYQLQQESVHQKNETLLLKSVLGAQRHFLSFSILGSSAPIVRLKELVQKIAQAPMATVLLQGESGTGKSHVARVLHHLSFAESAPFVEVNCAAIPENLLEAELFGYEKGAFTHALKTRTGLVAEAHGGTLFLDEIGEMPLNLQAKLLHVLETRKFRRLGSSQEQSVQMRCMAATNRDLKAAVEHKQFREDLFYRLNVVALGLPPLRELGEDVLSFAQHFLRVYNLDFKKSVAGFSAEAKRLLQSYHWPGNVRELRNIIERAMIFCNGSEIQAQDLFLASPSSAPAENQGFRLPAAGLALEELEKSLLTQALEYAKGNKTRAAALLGLSRDTFRYRLEKFGIE